MLISLCLILSSCTEKDPKTRSFKFFYHLTIPNIPEKARQLDIWIPIPQSDSYQQIYDLKVDCPYPSSIHTETVFGNRMLYVRAEKNLSAPLSIDLSFKTVRQERMDLERDDRRKAHESREDLQKYLLPNDLVPIDGIIAQEAAQVIQDPMSDLEKARAIFEHVTRTVAYDKSGTGWGRGDAIYACNARKGNCTDFHSLFIGMARASGIPARFVIGFSIPKAIEGEIEGYHCWAEFYIPEKGWIPIDASEAYKHPEKHEFFFGHLDADRVKFTMGRDIPLEPPLSSDLLNYFIYPYVLLDGKPYRPIETHFRFKSIHDQESE